MLHTKALYNLLRINNPKDADPWSVEDLRKVSLETLKKRLESFQIIFDEKTFLEFAATCDTPEELSEILLPDHISDELHDPFYLIIFELWRRLIPSKQSLSIFCDELDCRIMAYDNAEEGSEEKVHDALLDLLEILDDNTSEEQNPKEVFKVIAEFCGSDLESFIYDFSSDLIDEGHTLHASEIVEGFSRYVSESVWLDFLKARLLYDTDAQSANVAIHHILESEIELALVLDILQFLIAHHDRELITLTISKALELVESQEDLNELLTMTADLYHRIDDEKMELQIQKLIQKDIELDAPINQDIVARFKSLVMQ